MPYYDYDNNHDGDDDDDDGDDDVGNKKQNKYQQPPQTERKSYQILNTIRERRAANIFNENYVTDAQNNGKWFGCNLIRNFFAQMTCRPKYERQACRFTPTFDTKQRTDSCEGKKKQTPTTTLKQTLKTWDTQRTDRMKSKKKKYEQEAFADRQKGKIKS